MADSTIKLTMQGVDNASQTIKQVKNSLEGLGKTTAATNGKMNFGKLLDAGVKQATKALGQMGGALSSLGPIGIATGLLIAGAIKRYKFEVEQAKKAIQDQAEALKAMGSNMEKVNSHIERRLKLETQLRDLQDEIDGANPVQRAETKVKNIDAEIEAVKKELENAKGVQQVSLRQAGQNTLDVETVGWGHAVWWETGTEAANKERLKAAEDARKQAMDATEKMVELQNRLKILEKQRELAEKNIGQAQEEMEKKEAEAVEATQKTSQKALEDKQKELEQQDKLIEKLQKQYELDQLRADLQEEQTRLAQLEGATGDSVKLSETFNAGSHATNLLLDKLNGSGRDSTTEKISDSVKATKDAIEKIQKRIEALTKTDISKELQEANTQRDKLIKELDELQAI